MTPQPVSQVQSSFAGLWTLERGLGDEFTPALRAAWDTAFSALSEAMIASAYPSAVQTGGSRP